MSAEMLIDARCSCEACESRPFLLLYRADYKAADQDCPVCQSYWSVKASRLATDEEIPAAVLRPPTPEGGAER